MASTYMLRFPRSDAQDEYVLVQAAPTGSQPLDLKLVGTDGQDPYAFSLRADRISKHRETSAPCTDDEWESILTAVLTDQEALEDIEVTARVYSESQIEITFKKKIEQFSQRLGTLSLKHKPDLEIEVLEWCSLAIGSREDLKARLASANHKASKLETAVSELKKDLEALLKEKDVDEKSLLEGLQKVVNEKKVKIREQQRLLASANVSAERAAPSQAESEPETKPTKKKPTKKPAPARAAGPSRRGKRKAEQQVVQSEEEESDDGFERMDVDQREDVPLDEEQMSTEAEETASETDGDGDDDESPPPISSQRNRNGSSQTKGVKADSEAPPSQNTRHKTEEAQKAPPAPRRLPFGASKPTESKPSAAPPADAGSETESDDEL